MQQNTAIMDLIASYDTYADADELNVSAAADAPATTLPCAAALSAGYSVSYVSTVYTNFFGC